MILMCSRSINEKSHLCLANLNVPINFNCAHAPPPSYTGLQWGIRQFGNIKQISHKMPPPPPPSRPTMGH